jgi:hypothetical protein
MPKNGSRRAADAATCSVSTNSSVTEPTHQPDITQAAPATRRIDEIVIGELHRRDLGDIDGLAASIAELRLLHPVVVRPDGRLIAGERRLAACVSAPTASAQSTGVGVSRRDEVLARSSNRPPDCMDRAHSPATDGGAP